MTEKHRMGMQHNGLFIIGFVQKKPKKHIFSMPTNTKAHTLAILQPPFPKAVLVLKDGSVFEGYSIGVAGECVGEVVFNTAMTGYQEILTDPSYYGQIVTLTYPHIGNYGVNDEDVESATIFASGLIIKDLPLQSSNFRALQSLDQYLKTNNKVGIAGIDTRKLTRHLRSHGAQNACIIALEYPQLSLTPAMYQKAQQAAKLAPDMSGLDLVKEVTTAKSYTWSQGKWDLYTGYQDASIQQYYHVVAYDFGVKFNILRLLADRGCRLTVVPAHTPAQKILDLQPDGVFFSNGPGDPDPCTYTIEAAKKIIDSGLPVFGICLGFQILALASGAKTYKMKFGHHGANHPVKDMENGRVSITSQNHGFAVDSKALPSQLQITHTSLFDGSLQGLKRMDKPVFGFQGHPEASPGPQDIEYLFDRFIELMQLNRPM
jgi:carbamoyl-phosphate synthase small subunit